MKRAHLEFWRGRLNLQSLGDLDGTLPAVEEAIRELQGNGLSPKTLQNYVESLKSFARWAVKRRYLREDPLKDFVPFDTTPKTERRSFTPSELEKLFAVAPAARQLLYELALTSGLRRKELESLLPDDLDSERGGLHLRPETTKNRRGGFQVIPWDLAKRLQDLVDAGAAPAGTLLYVGSHTGREIGRDLVAAEISKNTPRGRLDFHACRVTFATLLDQAGASAKETETLLRHRPSGITSRVYTKAGDDRLRELVEAVGKVVREAKEPSRNITGAVRKAAGAESLCLETSCGDVDAGSMPAASTTWPRYKSRTQTAQKHYKPPPNPHFRQFRLLRIRDRIKHLPNRKNILFCTQSVYIVCTAQARNLNNHHNHRIWRASLKPGRSYRKRSRLTSWRWWRLR
ncbi:MAG: tyrosine-type recombinase/integrase [Planctomycetes bacterium]|nr:tyrosine-type recombinase/integrase [Planctomycetota bacterium]